METAEAGEGDPFASAMRLQLNRLRLVRLWQSQTWDERGKYRPRQHPAVADDSYQLVGFDWLAQHMSRSGQLTTHRTRGHSRP